MEAALLFIAVTDYPLKNADEATLRELLAMYQERMVTLSEMAENSRFFFQEPVYDAEAVEKHVKNNNGLEYLREIRDILDPVTLWTKESLAAPMERVLSPWRKKGRSPPRPSASPSAEGRCPRRCLRPLRCWAVIKPSRRARAMA